MKELSTSEALELGVSTCHHQMDNGEKRFRLSTQFGSSYILTLSPDKAAWQNSHYHKEKREFYIVEKGWILMAMLDDEGVIIKKISEDESIMMPLGVKHNVFISENTILHTVKYGTEETDWNPSPELDELVKDIDTSKYI